MGQLTVRNVDDEIIRQLKIRAAENGRSAEAEHREILRQVLSRDKDWEAWRARKEAAGRDRAFAWRQHRHHPQVPG